MRSPVVRTSLRSWLHLAGTTMSIAWNAATKDTECTLSSTLTITVAVPGFGDANGCWLVRMSVQTAASTKIYYVHSYNYYNGSTTYEYFDNAGVQSMYLVLRLVGRIKQHSWTDLAQQVVMSSAAPNTKRRRSKTFSELGRG